MNIYHRYFIQFMLKSSVSTVSSALEFCKNISRGDIENLTQLRTLIIEINREISKQSFKLVFFTCEVTKEELVVWINTRNDKISKLQITYSALELEYFHAILQEIINSEENSISSPVCINVTSTLTASFSRENGERVLMKWLKAGYFIKEEGDIYLGPRLILEFTSYLKTHCPDSICNLCSELVFFGGKCYSCHKTMHSQCLSKYLKNQNKCPCCHNIWLSDDENHETNGEHSANNVQRFMQINEES